MDKSNPLINVESDNNGDFFDFNTLLKIFIRRKKIIYVSSSLSLLIIIIYTIFVRIFFPIYGGSFKLLINDPITRQVNPYESLGSKPDAVFDYVARNTESIINDIPTLIEYLKSQAIIDKIAIKYKKDFRSLKNNISVKIVNDPKQFESPAQVLSIYYKNKNPILGFEILNSLADEYLEASVKIRNIRLSEGLRFLDLLEPELKKNTAEVRNEIAIFREENNLLNPISEAQNLKNRIKDLEVEIYKLKSEEDRLKIIEKEVRKGNLVSTGLEIQENEGVSSKGSGLVISDSNQSILEELVELRKLYAQYLTKYLPSSDLVKGVKKKIEFLEPLVLKKQLETVNSAIELKRGLIKSYLKQKDLLNKEFLKQPKYISDYQALDTKLELAEEKEKALIKARENFQLEITQRNTSWIILEKPFFNKNPISPKIFNYLSFGLLASILIGPIIALIRDFYENIFLDADSVQKTLNRKVLIDIPFFKNIRSKQTSLDKKIDYYLNYQPSKKILEGDYYNLIFNQEALRNLYTNLNSLITKNNLKIITLTSSVIGEGKSFVNSLIAQVFANNGSKVLLIDADIRNPTLHQKFQINNKNGLTNCISDGNQELTKYINLINQNFSVLTSGPTNIDPTKILSSSNMGKFIKFIKDSNNYDLVIIDSPPILGISDYKIISEYTDGIILLIALRHCKKNFAQNAYEEILNSSSNFIGILTNSLDNLGPIKKEEQILNYYGKNNYNSKAKTKTLNFGNNRKIIKLFLKLKKFIKWIDK